MNRIASFIPAVVVQFLDGSTPASRTLVAIACAAPFLLILWCGNWIALLQPVSTIGVRPNAVLVTQAVLSTSLVSCAGVWWYLWPRRESPERVPRASIAAALPIGMVYMVVMIATGTFTSNASLALLGVLAVGLMLFERRTMLVAFTACVFVYVCYDLLVMTGHASYAPAIMPTAFEGTEPRLWWSVWRNTVFYLSWVIILSLSFMLFSRLDALHQELGKLSYTDVLTGLANRRYFMERVEAETRRYHRTRQPYCVMLLDADHFKRVNDRFGHVAGDEVLRRLAEILAECVRAPTDQPARVGGEEFAVLLPDTTLAASEAVCKRISAGLRAHEFVLDGETFTVTVSIGVVECRGQAVESVFQQADRNLYVAKDQGRSRAIYSTAEGPPA